MKGPTLKASASLSSFTVEIWTFLARLILSWPHFSVAEIPDKPVTVFRGENGRIEVKLSFNPEVSNVLIVNARALGDTESDCTVKFDMGGVSRSQVYFKLFYSILCPQVMWLTNIIVVCAWCWFQNFNPPFKAASQWF